MYITESVSCRRRLFNLFLNSPIYPNLSRCICSVLLSNLFTVSCIYVHRYLSQSNHCRIFHYLYYLCFTQFCRPFRRYFCCEIIPLKNLLSPTYNMYRDVISRGVMFRRTLRSVSSFVCSIKINTDITSSSNFFIFGYFQLVRSSLDKSTPFHHSQSDSCQQLGVLHANLPLYYVYFFLNTKLSSILSVSHCCWPPPSDAARPHVKRLLNFPLDLHRAYPIAHIDLVGKRLAASPSLSIVFLNVKPP